jgi:hypothetical protein
MCISIVYIYTCWTLPPGQFRIIGMYLLRLSSRIFVCWVECKMAQSLNSAKYSHLLSLLRLNHHANHDSLTFIWYAFQYCAPPMGPWILNRSLAALFRKNVTGASQGPRLPFSSSAAPFLTKEMSCIFFSFHPRASRSPSLQAGTTQKTS